MKPNSFPTVSVADLASLSRMATGEGRRGRGRKATCAHAMKIGGEIAAHAAKEKCARILEGFDGSVREAKTKALRHALCTSSPPLPCASRLRSRRRLISLSSPMSRLLSPPRPSMAARGPYHIVVITNPDTQPIEIRLGRGDRPGDSPYATLAPGASASFVTPDSLFVLSACLPKWDLGRRPQRTNAPGNAFRPSGGVTPKIGRARARRFQRRQAHRCARARAIRRLKPGRHRANGRGNRHRG
jgi:hypothetical protein